MLIDWSLFFTIGLIFFVTLLGAWLRSRRIDRCLKSLNGYHVTVEREGGHRIWGVMEISSTGMELHYRRVVEDTMHIESSYVLPASEYSDIHIIFRFDDDLDPRWRVLRQRDIKRSFRPGPIQYLLRKTRNFLSNAADAVNEVIGVVVGRAKGRGSAYFTDTSETYLRQMGSTVIGQAGLENDPLLERFLGSKVVIELAEGDEVHEHVGIFKDYSADFLQLLDVLFPFPRVMKLSNDSERQSESVVVRVKDGQVLVDNQRKLPILVTQIGYGDSEQALDAVVEAETTITIRPNQPIENAELRYSLIREADIVVPRTHAVVRHRAEPIPPESFIDMIFDVGVRLTKGDADQRREERLRNQLAEDPTDATAAAALGVIMMQKKNYKEAESLLQEAYEYRSSLPDNGRRIQLLLQELQRRRTDASLRAQPESTTPAQ